MIQHEPDRVAAVSFVDPVVIMLNLKSTLYNFLYRHSTNGKISDLVGTELFLNHALRRHFWWYRNIIWAQDMHRAGIPSQVIVSENDEVTFFVPFCVLRGVFVLVPWVGCKSGDAGISFGH